MIYKCPHCGSSNGETMCRVVNTIEFRCRTCDRWYSVTDNTGSKRQKVTTKATLKKTKERILTDRKNKEYRR